MTPSARRPLLLRTLASLRLAVFLMVSLGGIAAFATFHEMNHGTAAVQRLVYRSWWFTSLLALLAVSIAAVMIDRWPWRRHHAGFLLAHAGILLILGGSLLSLHSGLDSTMALYEGESTDRVTLFDKTLQVALPARGAVVCPLDADGLVVAEGAERRVGVPGSDVTLVVLRALAHADVVESWADRSSGPTVLHFLLEAPFAKQEGWLVLGDPARERLDFGPVAISFREVSSLARDGGSVSDVVVLRAEDGTLRVAVPGRSVQPLAVPGRVDLGGMNVTVLRLLAHAAPTRDVREVAELPRVERRQAAVRVRLESPAGQSEPVWIPWGEAASLPFGGGIASVAFRAPELSLPFRVTLRRFQSKKYPGSSMPATYESRVTVEDPEAGVSEHLISMNEPLHHRGYIFFQSSFVEGTPMASIFSVARAPGLPFVYLGTTLVGAGVAWMFYLKPWLARRQGRKALEAHRERESGREEIDKPPLSRPAPGLASDPPGGV